MTWEYDQSLATDKDKVRFEIQDTDSGDPLFSDEEITATLAAFSGTGAVVMASAKLARTLAIKFARFVNSTVGKVSESASDRYKAYKELADDLEVRATRLCTPRFGGTEVAKNDTADADVGMVQPRAAIGDSDDTHDTSTFGVGGGGGSNVLPPS